MQEQRHEPSDRSSCPLVRQKKLLKRSDHKPLGQDAVKYRHQASDDSGHSQGSVLPIRVHTTFALPRLATSGRRYCGAGNSVQPIKSFRKSTSEKVERDRLKPNWPISAYGPKRPTI